MKAKDRKLNPIQEKEGLSMTEVLSSSTLSSPEKPVAIVRHIDDIPTYYGLHDKREVKILFDDDFGGAKNCAVEYIIYQKGDEVEMHKHDDSEHAFIILKGRGFFECDSGRYQIREGSVMFIPKGANHRIGNDSDGEMVLLEIFAPPTQSRKTGLATCYAIPQWSKYYNEDLAKRKDTFAKSKGLYPRNQTA